MKPIKILLVDDSPTMREHLAAIITEDPHLILVGQARNGEEAVRMTRSLKPDVISMDVHMPVMNGLESVKEIMRLHPTPIVVVSGSLQNSELNIAFNAIRAGALAVIGKPPAPNHPGYRAACDEFRDTLRNMSDVRVIHRWSSPSEPKKPLGYVSPIEPTSKIDVVGIASSTGGPSALADILSQIPGNFPVPILVVQHISSSFEDGLINWLDRVSPLDVRLAHDGQLLQPGQVTIAPSGFHCFVHRGGIIRLDSHRSDYLNMPSADITLTSLASVYSAQALGIILTGMGNDGAAGIKAIYDAGGRTIAQDQASSVVFGMPKEAIALGGVEYVLPLNKIARTVLSLVTPAYLARS